MIRHKQLKLPILLSVALGVSAAASAQVPKSAVAKSKPGELDGTVLNAKGAPVAGAQVLWQAGRVARGLRS